MADLILRASAFVPDRPWALQLRYHEHCGPVDDYAICRVSDETAREIIRAGAPFWLFGDPDARPAAPTSQSENKAPPDP